MPCIIFLETPDIVDSETALQAEAYLVEGYRAQ